ncbi:MAG TPA: glucose-1-phosphate thymidylyltransferase, partial [Nitrosopumilaceae archaeon]|nr:glucose-1-phosphate thymidylyltransferase [Nitrosopumilaceae archaeon]
MNSLKGIILHGGHGTRLRPLTHTGPKQLLPIANKPMSQYCIESLRDAEVTDIAIIIGGLGSNKVQEYYGSGERFGVKLTYIEQDSPRGIAHAIRLCKEFVNNQKFIVFLGDNILKRSISDYAINFQQSDAKASILLCEVSNPTQFGIADVKDGIIKKIMEKPKNPPTNLAVTGIYFLTPSIFEIIDRLKPSWRNELEITDALQMLLEEGNKITYYMVTDYWKDTGTPQDIIHANNVILEDMKPYFLGKKEADVSISGNVMVGENTVLKTGSKIIGPVIIGKNCTIDSGTQIGPNTSIGDESHIAK